MGNKCVRLAVLAVVFSVGLTFSTLEVRAEDVGCVFDGAKLDCSRGVKRPSAENVTKAFASEKTKKLFDDPHGEMERFPQPILREVFRKSFEKSWKTVNLYDRISLRAMKRHKISEDEYNERLKLHKSATATYTSAYWFYKALNWQSER